MWDGPLQILKTIVSAIPWRFGYCHDPCVQGVSFSNPTRWSRFFDQFSPNVLGVTHIHPNSIVTHLQMQWAYL